MNPLLSPREVALIHFVSQQMGPGLLFDWPGRLFVVRRNNLPPWLGLREPNPPATLVDLIHEAGSLPADQGTVRSFHIERTRIPWGWHSSADVYALDAKDCERVFEASMKLACESQWFQLDHDDPMRRRRSCAALLAVLSRGQAEEMVPMPAPAFTRTVAEARARRLEPK